MKINQLLRFEPIPKEKIWGGEKLRTLFKKNFQGERLGESWEISDIENNISVVSNGKLRAKNLKQLLIEFKADLVGKKIYEHFGESFPLLIKFIDAKQPLSIQLHPQDDLAKKRHNSFGKTEMWYVIQADKNADLIVGFKKDTTREKYLHHLKDKTLTDILNIDKVQKKDVYFIPTGRIHAIGAGVLLAEIQQTSDITYRLYDWDRPNPDGTLRELHTEQALDAIEYKSESPYKTGYKTEQNKSLEIISCPYFTTNVLSINKELLVDHSKKDSFVIYLCVEGSVCFEYKNQSERIKMGETLLVPACIKKIKIVCEQASELLEVYIK